MSPREDFAAIVADREGLVFAEPWQAQAFALAVHLSEAGHFTWTEWTDTLGDVLRHFDGGAGQDYYLCWVSALERLSVAKGLADVAALARRADAWAEAYRNTPHGRAVELAGYGDAL